MEKESYNIDDILSEVKKHKEKELREAENAFKPDENAEGFTINTEEKSVITEEPTETEQEVQAEEEPQEEIFSITEEDPAEDFATQEQEAEEQEPVVEAVTEDRTHSVNDAEKQPTQVEETEEEGDGEAETVIKEEKSDIPDGFVDLLEIANETEALEEAPIEPKKKKEKKKASKKSRTIRIILLFIVFIFSLAVVFGVVYIDRALDNMTDDSASQEQWGGMDQLIENFPTINETEASQLSSLQDMIRDWYYNGAPCSSSHVLNVLLIGEDTRGDEILEDETRADAAIIASVNIDTKTITLTSVLRDTYAYWEDTPGDENTAEFGKINGAMSMAGIDGYINCIESLYKIDIDNYVIVNFTSFESIIDQIGGVEIEITAAEIYEINSHPSRYGDVYIEQSFEGDSGTMLLDGKQALAYCRIRKIDSDNARADRQKICLNQIFEGVKDGSTVTQLKVVNALLPYVKTGFSSREILSIAQYALSQGWLSYDVQMTTVPYARINERGAGGTYYGAWCWKADFPQDAYYLQTLIYGKSSVILARERVDILNCNLYGFYEDNLTPCYAIIYNYNYGEVTTYVSEEEETTTSN